MGSGMIRYIRTSKTFSKLRALRRSVGEPGTLLYLIIQFNLRYENFYHHQLSHEGPERHISCLARYYFANARKMLWSCVENF